MLRIPTTLLVVALVLAGAHARAADFDEQGYLVPDPGATAFEGFLAPVRYLPDQLEMGCVAEGYDVVTGPALEGDTYLNLHVSDECTERFSVEVPAVQASYRATVWLRHGGVGARMTVSYPERTGIASLSARMAPTGRATSDGWIELASNDFPVDGTQMPVVYLRVADTVYDDGVDIDALELVPSGAFYAPTTCNGVRDAVCGDEGFCYGGTCRLGGLGVPARRSARRARDDGADA